MGDKDPMYEDAVRVVCEVVKASTSVLQAAVAVGVWASGADPGLDAEGQDYWSAGWVRPRDVLRRPDWLDNPNVEFQT